MTAGLGTVASQTVTLTTPTPSASFTALVRYLDAAIGWLSVSPASGTGPATLAVSADASQLASGTYLGQVVIESAGVGAVVNVSLTVTAGSPGGTVIVNPSTLTFVG